MLSGSFRNIFCWCLKLTFPFDHMQEVWKVSTTAGAKPKKGKKGTSGADNTKESETKKSSASASKQGDSSQVSDF